MFAALVLIIDDALVVVEQTMNPMRSILKKYDSLLL
jgi:hypothetical protein